MKRSYSIAWLVAVWSAGLLAAAAAWHANQPVVIPTAHVDPVSSTAPVQSDAIRVAQPVTIVGHVSAAKPTASHDPLRHCSEWKDLEQGSGQVRICG